MALFGEMHSGIYEVRKKVLKSKYLIDYFINILEINTSNFKLGLKPKISVLEHAY